MTGPTIAFIIFLVLICILYYYEEYLSWIAKSFSILFAFLLLIIPQYIDSIPNYIFYKTQMLNYNINESKLYDSNFSNLDSDSIVKNQNNECIYCKKKLKKYIIKNYNMLNPQLSSYYAICNRCNKKM